MAILFATDGVGYGGGNKKSIQCALEREALLYSTPNVMLMDKNALSQMCEYLHIFVLSSTVAIKTNIRLISMVVPTLAYFGLCISLFSRPSQIALQASWQKPIWTNKDFAENDATKVKAGSCDAA